MEWEETVPATPAGHGTYKYKRIEQRLVRWLGSTILGLVCN